MPRQIDLATEPSNRSGQILHLRDVASGGKGGLELLKRQAGVARGFGLLRLSHQLCHCIVPQLHAGIIEQPGEEFFRPRAIDACHQIEGQPAGPRLMAGVSQKGTQWLGIEPGMPGHDLVDRCQQPASGQRVGPIHGGQNAWQRTNIGRRHHVPSRPRRRVATPFVIHRANGPKRRLKRLFSGWRSPALCGHAQHEQHEQTDHKRSRQPPEANRHRPLTAQPDIRPLHRTSLRNLWTLTTIAGCGKHNPPLDAAGVDPGNPRRFLRSTSWKKARDGFFHRQIRATTAQALAIASCAT